MEQGQGEEDSGADNTIESLIKEMDDKLMTPDEVPPATTEVDDAPACLISWVSDAVDRGEYEPDQVHIGPFHWDPSHWMEKEKKDRLHGLLPDDQTWRQRELRRYLTAMGGLECRARRCYNRTFSRMTREAFACMLLLDGCFLLSCFVPVVLDQESRSRVPDEDITVVRDVVFLLENQIPFFVLEEIHKLITSGAEDDDSAFVVVDNVARHVETLVRRHGYVSKEVTLEQRQRPCHLLHLLYMYFRPTALDTAKEVQLTVHINGSTSSPEDMPTAVPPARWRAATYYYVAGVRLVKRELDSDKVRSILDVELKGGTLHVPCLMVDSNTWRILRNMVALEQHSPRLGSHVTAYCLFMSQIASTEKDVALLVRKGIIVHFLGSDADVATGLGKLCDGVVLDVSNPDLSYLRPEQEALEKLCRDGWRKAMAWLRHSKCNNYLMALAVAAAVVVFICAVEQSVFAALAYAKGRNS